MYIRLPCEEFNISHIESSQGVLSFDAFFSLFLKSQPTVRSVVVLLFPQLSFYQLKRHFTSGTLSLTFQQLLVQKYGRANVRYLIDRNRTPKGLPFCCGSSLYSSGSEYLVLPLTWTMSSSDMIRFMFFTSEYFCFVYVTPCVL